MESKFKNAKKVLHRAVITEDSQIAITHFLQLKNERKPGIIHYPKWDVPKRNSSVEVMRSRFELSQSETDLRQKLKDRESWKKEMDRKWEELEKKQREHQRHLTISEAFLIENKHKRDRALQTIEMEKRNQTKLNSNIQKLSGKIQKLRDVKNKMAEYISKNEMYSEFLEKVVEKSEEFHTTADIQNRYDTLIGASSTILKNHEKKLQELDDTAARMNHMIESRTQKLTVLKHKMSRLQEKYNGAEKGVEKWKIVTARVKNAAAIKDRDLIMIRASCWNMYKQICKKIGIKKKVDRNNLEQQLEVIKRAVLELSRVVKLCEKMAGE